MQMQMQCNAMRCNNADAKVKPVLVFAVLNSVGEMRAMHADTKRDATLLGKTCDDCAYVMLTLLSSM